METAIDSARFIVKTGLVGLLARWLTSTAWPAWKYRRPLAWGHGRSWARYLDQARRYQELEKQRLSCSQCIRSKSGICGQHRSEQIAITEISEAEGAAAIERFLDKEDQREGRQWFAYRDKRMTLPYSETR